MLNCWVESFHHRNLSPVISLLTLFILALFIGCGGGGGGGGGGGVGGVGNLDGTYSGSWVNSLDASDSGSWELEFDQDGASFIGSITIPGEGLVDVSGTVDGNIVTFADPLGGGNASAVIEGDTIYGTVHSSSGNEYNFSGSCSSGVPISPTTEGDVVIGGTPVNGDPPLPTDSLNAPVISNLEITPAQGPPNSNVRFDIHFDDINGDVSSFAVNFISKSNYFTYNTSATTSGQTSFDLFLQDFIGDIPPQTLQVQIFVVDSSGNVSNYLNGTFTVTGDGALTSIDLEEYWPLHDGDTWTYDAGTVSISTTTFPPYITQSVFRISRSFSTDMLQAYDSAGFLLHFGGIRSNGNFYINTPSSTAIPKIMEIGREYYLQGRRDDYDSLHTYGGTTTDSSILRVTGPEVITVPAGTFSAYRVNLRNTYSGYSNGYEEFNYWLVRDIGPVRIENVGQGIGNLISAKVNGVNY